MRLRRVRLIILALIAPFLACAQTPRIGIIDFYGLHRTSESRARKALGLSEGDPLPGSKVKLEERLEAISGIVRARVEAVCCEQGKAVIYVGVEEKGAPRFEFRPEPAGTATLPDEVTGAYHKLLIAFEQAARRGQTAEDLTKGHALSADPETRELQQSLQPMAEKYLVNLREVMRNSADPEQRAIAAYVIAYAPTKRLIVDDLQLAMQDPDESVRANAIRSLGIIAGLGQKDLELGIRVQPTWFIEMLNSLVWSDRTRASAALVQMTENRDERILAQIKERALNSLVQMAQWREFKHALPAFLLLGRVAGVPEQQIHASWESGERASSVLSFLKSLESKK